MVSAIWLSCYRTIDTSWTSNISLMRIDSLRISPFVDIGKVSTLSSAKILDDHANPLPSAARRMKRHCEWSQRSAKALIVGITSEECPDGFMQCASSNAMPRGSTAFVRTAHSLGCVLADALGFDAISPRSEAYLSLWSSAKSARSSVQ